MARGNGKAGLRSQLWEDVDDVPIPLSSMESLRPSSGAATATRPLSPPSTADEFSDERMLRPRPVIPARGWRLAVHRLTGGAVSPGPSAAELRERELIARVKTPIRGCHKIAFISRKGGVGKTSTCLLAGHTFAAYRGDRVIALDGNPDAGTLGHRLRRETTATVTGLLGDADRIERYADIRGYTSQAPSRLEVVAADDDPHITEAIGESEFRRAIALLECHYNLVCLDTGTGVLDSATRGILDAADQVVVVCAPSLDGARAASSTLDWLGAHGYEHRAESAIAVLNAIRPTRGFVDIDRIETHFASRCRTCLRIPWDPHLEAGAEVVVERLAPETRRAYLELAAAIASRFSEPT